MLRHQGSQPSERSTGQTRAESVGLGPLNTHTPNQFCETGLGLHTCHHDRHRTAELGSVTNRRQIAANSVGKLLTRCRLLYTVPSEHGQHAIERTEWLPRRWKAADKQTVGVLTVPQFLAVARPTTLLPPAPAGQLHRAPRCARIPGINVP